MLQRAGGYWDLCQSIDRLYTLIYFHVNVEKTLKNAISNIILISSVCVSKTGEQTLFFHWPHNKMPPRCFFESFICHKSYPGSHRIVASMLQRKSWKKPNSPAGTVIHSEFGVVLQGWKPTCPYDLQDDQKPLMLPLIPQPTDWLEQ